MDFKKAFLIGAIGVGLVSSSYSMKDYEVPRSKKEKLAELRSALDVFHSQNTSKANPKSLKEMIDEVPMYKNLKFNEEDFSYDSTKGEIHYEPKNGQGYVINLLNVHDAKEETDIITDNLKLKGWNAETIGIYNKEQSTTHYHTIVSSSSFLRKEDLYQRIMKESSSWGRIEYQETVDEEKQIENQASEMLKSIDEKNLSKVKSFYNDEIVEPGSNNKEKITDALLSKLKILKHSDLEKELQFIEVRECIKEGGTLNNKWITINLPDCYSISFQFSKKSGINNFNCIAKKIKNSWKIISVYEQLPFKNDIISAFEE